jgi:hypothetical protein
VLSGNRRKRPGIAPTRDVPASRRQPAIPVLLVTLYLEVMETKKQLERKSCAHIADLVENIYKGKYVRYACD